MFERFTPHANQAIVLSQETARNLGQDTIDSGSLLLGMMASQHGVAVKVLTGLGISPSELTTLITAGRSRTDLPLDGHLRFAAESKTIFDLAQRQSANLGHTDLTTGHLLLALLLLPNCSGAQALAALNPDLAAIRDAVHHHHKNDPTGELNAKKHPYDSALASARLGPPPKLPGRRELLRSIGLSLIWYLAMAGWVIAITWPGAGPELVVTILAVFLAMTAVVAPLAGSRALRSVLAKEPRLLLVPDKLSELLARHGMTSFEILMGTDARIRDASLRLGRQAWILLSEHTLAQPTPLPFVLSHEIAHLIRHDVLRRRINWGLYISLGFAAFVSFSPTAWLVVASGCTLHWVATAWSSELACDRIAVKWAGIAPFSAWAALHRALLRQPQNRLRRFTPSLSHPPLSARIALAQRQANARSHA